jgi:hypothetical protein
LPEFTRRSNCASSASADVLVDAEPDQVRVADAGEEPVVGGLRDLFERRLNLLDGSLVADVDDAERLVHGELAAGRIVDRLVVRQDLD